MPTSAPTSSYNFHNLLVIDIETVPLVEDFNSLSLPTQQHWLDKSQKLHPNLENLTEHEHQFRQKAGIYAEFGKIICIGLGMFSNENYSEIRLKPIYHEEEEKLLEAFFAILTKMEKQGPIIFCGHNIKEFDLAYICRRAIIHHLKLPHCLQLSMLKPWQNPHLDTLEMWRFGDYKHYITLDLLAHTLGVPSSKNDISGKDVAKVYYQDKDLARISAYCLNDVYTTALVFLRLQEIPYTEVIPTFVE